MKRKVIHSLPLILLLTAGFCLQAQTIRYVKEGAAGDGSSWSNASGDLQAIINASASGDEVWVAAGTYKPTLNYLGGNPANARVKTFVMKNGVGIYGGFTGSEIQRVQRNWKASVTALSGDLGTPNDNSDNCYHVILNEDNNLDNTARLDGFTITGGNANGIFSIDGRGGGVNHVSSSPVYANCIFTGNRADGDGGGMVNQGASPTLINCSFTGNNSGSGGGGMYNFVSASPSLINCSFAGNSAAYGGAIRNESSPTLTNCIIWGNSSGIYGPATITYSIVQGGYAGTGNLNKDPLFVSATDLHLQACSPAINAGNDAANTTDKDLDNNNRKVGTIDMGAYEYQGTPGTALFISTQPQLTQSVCQNNTPAALKVVADGSSLTYQWYSNTTNSNSGGTAIDGANTDSYTPPPAATTGTQYYYVVVSNACASVNSSVAAIMVTTAQSRLYVNASATGANTGLSWQDAFTDLQSALNYTCLSNPAEIWVAKGTYKPTTGSDRAISFSMKNGVGIYGGFAGTETNLNDRNWKTNVTTLSGDIGTVGDNSDNSYRVVFNNNNGLDNTAVLNGFTLTAGNNNQAYPYNYGGGMNNTYVSPTIINCIFIANMAVEGGGGMYNDDSNPTLINCSFQGNTAGRDGGGIYNYYGVPVLTNCAFSGNAAGHAGGGMYNRYSYSPTLTNCSFSGNSAPITGGIYNFEFCELTLNNCILWGDASGEIYNGFTCYVHLYNSIVQGGCPQFSGCTNVLDKDPLFVSTTNLHLQPCSPAIDAGLNSSVPSTVTTDIDGNPRISNATGQPTAIVDMGAYEFVGSALTTYYKDVDGDGYGDGTSLSQCQRPNGYKPATELTATSGDCNDASATVHPGAAEICGNGIDDNCNNQVDENCGPCRTATNLTTTNITSSGAQLAWVANTTPVQWQVQYKSLATGSKWKTVTVSGSARSLVLNGLQANQRYKWQLRAKCGKSWTSWSYEAEFKTVQPGSIITIAEQRGAAPLTEEAQTLVVPNLLHRSQVWRIPNLPAQNEIIVIDMSGRIVLKARNYGNAYNFSAAASGMYFYQVQTTGKDGTRQVYKGKMVIVE